MAWFLNPEEEKKRLLGFLAKCVSPQEAEVANASAALRSLSKRSDSFSLTEEPALRFSSERSAADFVPLFPGYQQADPWKAPCSPTEDIYATLAKRILYVVKCEHPIHVEELYRRLSPVFGRQKITAPIRRAIDDCIQGQLKRKVELRDDFLYLSGADIQAKSPQPGEEPRVIEHISPEEIQDAMCQILSLALGLPPKALLGETARQLGYARTGPKINEILAENYKALLAAGKIKETDGKAGLANL